MSSLFGGGSKNQTSQTKYTALQLQTSAQGLVLPYSPGKRRIGTNLIWAGDFLAVPEKNGGKKGGGGKGGKGGDGKGAGGVVYDYYVSVIMALCEGVVSAIGTVWEDKNTTTMSALGLTLFTGTASQAPWTYMTTNHPSEARSYAYTAYVAGSRYSLGKSPNLPNHNFEAVGSFSGTMAPYSVDCNYADIVYDYLTNPQYSVFLPTAAIDPTTWNNYKTYCQAQGLFMSPYISSAEQISATIDRWAQLSNTWIFWSGAGLKFVPLGDTTITNNGVTYTPVTTPVFNLSYDDFISSSSGSGDAPVTVTRSDPADATNRVRLETTDRGNAYNRTVCEWRDQGLVDQFGIVDGSNTQADEICDNTVGMITAQFIGFRGAYLRNNYDFKVGWEIGSVVEPGDIVTLTEPHIGLSLFPVRIKQLDEDQDGNWSVTAEEHPTGIGTLGAVQPFNTVTSFSGPAFNVDPGNTNPPAIFEPDSSLTNGIPQVWVAVSGGADWGGAVIMISFDNVNFQSIGSVSNPAIQGVLTADLPFGTDPDGTNTLSVDTSESVQNIPTIATNDDADAFRTLCWITDPYTTVAPTNGELIAYGNAIAGIGTFDTDMTYLRRGCYGTTDALHASGSFFTRIDITSSQPPGNTLLIYDLPPQYIGKTIYIKTVSINRFANSLQDESTAPVYSYTPTGAGFGGGTGGVPTVPTGLATAGVTNGVQVSWAANPDTDNVTLYKVYRANGHGAVFGSAALIGQINGLNYSDMGLTSAAQFTYFIVAENAIGDSNPTTGVDATVATSSTTFTINANQNGSLTSAQVLLDYVATSAFHLPAGLTGSFGGVSTGGTAPAITATFNIFKGAVNIGTMTIATGVTPGNNSATFSFSSTVTFAAGDHLRITGPSPADANLKSVFVSLLATAP